MVREPMGWTTTGWKVVTAGAATTAVAAVAFGLGTSMSGPPSDVGGIELVAQDEDLARLVTESAVVVPLVADDAQPNVRDDSSDSDLDSDDSATEFVAPQISATARAAAGDASATTQFASFDSSGDSLDSPDSPDSDDSPDSPDSDDSPDSVDSDDSLDS